MDRDLQSTQDARDLLAKARRAQVELEHFSQSQVDAICEAMAEAGQKEAERLARLAVEETKMGRVESKTIKNVLCTQMLWDAIKEMKTVGIIKRDDKKMLYEIAEPVGVVAAVIPTTNPTSTALYKIIISLKSRNAIVISPHPRAWRCIAESARVLHEAALKAGAPDGCINCMTEPTLEGTQELMRHRWTGVILATGGEGLVRAAYSSGKPAYGVGPGNVPAYIEKSADIRRAVANVIESQTFDYGTVCASEQSIIVDEAIKDEVMEEFRRQKAYFVTPDEKKLMEPVVVKGSIMNPDVVGQSAAKIAKMSGFTVPEDTTVLIVPLSKVAPEEPISREKLCPVLGWFVERDWQAACERCLQVLEFGGMGHTLVIHSRDERIIMEFAMKKPAYRLLVNTPTTLGSVGYTTNLLPSMTLGCGTWGGNITTDNIGPHNLLNIKRFAFAKDDPFAQQMKVSETLVSDWVPKSPRAERAQAAAPSSPPSPAASAQPVAAVAPKGSPAPNVVMYNGRKRDVRTL